MTGDASARHVAERRATMDLRPGAVLAVTLGTLAFVLLSLVGIWVFEQAMGRGTRVAPAGSFPGPHLQSDIAGELRAYRAVQQGRLNGYGWADRGAGLVRIPVSRAMEMIVKRGAEAYAPLDPPHWPEPQRR